MSLLNIDLALKLVYAMESELPVNDFVVDGIHLWPITRFSLIFIFVNNDIDPIKRAAEDPSWGALAGRIETAYNHYVAARGAEHSGDQERSFFDEPLAPCTVSNPGLDFLFFTRSDEHFFQSADGWFAPVLDPWFDVARDGHRAAKIEILTKLTMQRMPRVNTTLLLHPTGVVTSEMRDSEGGRRLAEGAAAIGQVVNRWLNKRLNLTVDMRSPIINNLSSAYRYKEMFDRILADLRPRNVLLNCYYHSLAFGVMWAAREMGCRTIDVQHGLNGQTHYGYTHWTRLPPEGYHLLPQHFLCWGLGSANNITRWTPAGHRHHRPLIGGRIPVPAGPGTTERADALRQRGQGYAKRVLVTLQSTDGTTIDNVILDLMLKAPRDWLWLVRTHPMAVPQQATKSQREYVGERLRDSGLDNWEIDLATDLPIDVVLQSCDHHVTHFSSVGIEAFGHGVPTTFVNRTANTFYSRVVEKRRAYLCLELDEIVASIEMGRDGLDWELASQESIVDPALARQIIDQFVE